MPSPASCPDGSPGAPPAPGERFAFALFLAVCLHAAVILGLTFQHPEKPAQATIVDVILTPAAEHPQASQASARPNDESSTQAAAAPAAARPSPETTAAQPREAPPGPAAPTISQAPANDAIAANPPSLDYADLGRKIAAIGLNLADQAATQGLTPRIRQLSSASTLNAAEAAYLRMWRERVERIGTANYPGKGLRGDLRVLVVIRHDGALLDARVLESSGAAKLDAAAMRIVRLAAPYAPFPVDMRKSYDQLEITRTWRFSRTGEPLTG